MPRIAVTGHMNLTPDTIPVIRTAVREALNAYDPKDLVGVSCIARGADAIFAEEVVGLGGSLEVIIPSENYRVTKVRPNDEATFDRLVSLAYKVRILPFVEASRIAYEAANQVLISESDELFAVWDGQDGVDAGSTAGVVSQARSLGLRTNVIWPNGARRE